jgi:hypothetical protein
MAAACCSGVPPRAAFFAAVWAAVLHDAEQYARRVFGPTRNAIPHVGHARSRGASGADFLQRVEQYRCPFLAAIGVPHVRHAVGVRAASFAASLHAREQ